VLTREQNSPEGEAVYGEVTRVFSRETDHLRTVLVEDAAGNVEAIVGTDEHPFWVAGMGWTPAGQLRSGQQLLTPDGALATIVATSREELASPVRVYNLEVAGTWTYFVEDGRGEQTAVWVHNRCDGHHPFPKYLGGDRLGQRYYHVDDALHRQFHSALTRNLNEAGFTRGVIGGRGSTAAWGRYFVRNPGMQAQAMAVLKQTARQFDQIHGTRFWGHLKGNIQTGRFTLIP
jgi:hypothetical protein